MNKLNEATQVLFGQFPVMGAAYNEQVSNKQKRKKLKSNERRCPNCYGILKYHGKMKEYKVCYSTYRNTPKVIKEINSGNDKKIEVKLYICTSNFCHSQYSFWKRIYRCHG